ncbi:MAG: thiamine diphosphokinase [Acidimicrobiia bacterium]
MTDICLILAGGDAAPPVDPVPHPGFVIAADGGLAMAERLGLYVDLVVGDLDSADPTSLVLAEGHGTIIERHPEDKDATDLELALDAAATRGFERVVIVGGTALDRVDHLLANAALVAAPRYAGLNLEWRMGASRVVALHESVDIDGEPGDIVSIVPMGGQVTVSTTGLEWVLDNEVLEPDSSRSISNRMVGDIAHLTAAGGHALVIHTRGTSA